MKEDLIAYLWKNKFIIPSGMLADNGEKIELLDPGQENMNAGPDFFAARIKIDNTIWVGNVEIHVRTSDWQKHGHQNDPAYDNIVLHVVYQNDAEVYTISGKRIPVLEIRGLIENHLIENYRNLTTNKNWVACQKNIQSVDPFFISNWLNRLLVERLERKADNILHYYKYFSNNWDQTFYFLLAHNFGFKVNSSAFSLMAQRTPFNLLAKSRNNLTTIEALLFGQAGLINSRYTDVYPRVLLREYTFYKNKHNLSPVDPALWRFAKLRPVNFPTIRIAQFAMLIYKQDRLFRKLIQSPTPQYIIKVLETKASPYWNDHYTFDQQSIAKEKKLGADAIYNLIINTIAPIQFVYGNLNMNARLKENAISLFQECPPENNSIITKWRNLGISPTNAADTQGLLELKKYYCTPQKCLRCPVGHIILRKK